MCHWLVFTVRCLQLTASVNSLWTGAASLLLLNYWTSTKKPTLKSAFKNQIFLKLQSQTDIFVVVQTNYYFSVFDTCRLASSAEAGFKRKPIANTYKVSARQQCMYEGPIAKKSTASQRNEHNDEKYIQWVTTLSLTIRVYLHSFSSCCLSDPQIPRNSLKVRTYSSSRPFNVIDLCAHCNFLLVINSNFGRIS